MPCINEKELQYEKMIIILLISFIVILFGIWIAVYRKFKSHIIEMQKVHSNNKIFIRGVAVDEKMKPVVMVEHIKKQLDSLLENDPVKDDMVQEQNPIVL